MQSLPLIKSFRPITILNPHSSNTFMEELWNHKLETIKILKIWKKSKTSSFEATYSSSRLRDAFPKCSHCVKRKAKLWTFNNKRLILSNFISLFKTRLTMYSKTEFLWVFALVCCNKFPIHETADVYLQFT